MYDWANSAFSTIVISALFGPYISSLLNKTSKLKIFGHLIEPNAVFPFLISISVLLQVAFLPLIGSLADKTGKKKELLLFFTFLGAIFTFGLSLFDILCFLFKKDSSIFLICTFFVLSNVCFGAACAIYNSFLPYIAEPSKRDMVSAFGWAIGYLGGGISLGICLIMFYLQSKHFAISFSFAFAAIWWLFFTLLFPARFLKNPNNLSQKSPLIKLFKDGIREVYSTILRLKKDNIQGFRFLLAFFCYNDGVQTIIVVSSLFAVSELGATSKDILFLLLFIQFIAFLGALFFGWLSERIGTKQSIILSLLIWIAIVIGAYLFLKDIIGLFILGFFVAIVLGGTQALSRSIFSFVIPNEKESEFYSFYEIGEKGSSWLGPLIFALFVQVTGNTRDAILSVILFFILGLIFLLKMDIE